MTPPTSKTLLEKLEALITYDGSPYNTGVCDAILVVRQHEPEPVSLEECAMAAAASDYSEADYPAFEDVGLFAAQNWPMFTEIAKAVLNAAKVKFK